MEIEINRESAIHFYHLAFEGNPRKAAELYAGEHYIEHNPEVRDGVVGFIEYFERMNREYPDRSLTVLRSVAEGEFVALHTHQAWQDGSQYVTMDFFRFDYQGKIVEHWDTKQRVPDGLAHDNGIV